MAGLANPSGTTGQGLQSNAWEKDSSRKTCHDCNLKFTIRRRRHHCRRCGRLFCKKCSAERVRLETYISPFGVMKNNKEEKLRVCDSCFIAVVKNVDQRVSNIRARRRSATLEKAQEFLNNPVAVTYAFTVNENDFSPASSSSLSGSNLSFASSTESIQDDSEEEVEETLISLTEEVDNNMKINNNNKTKVPAFSSQRLSTLVSQYSNVQKPTKRTVKAIAAHLLEQQKSQLRSDEILLESDIVELKKELAQLEKLIHGKQSKTDAKQVPNNNNNNDNKTNFDRRTKGGGDENTHATTAANILKYQLLSSQLMNEQIEQIFPESMRWILRMQPEPNLFLGIRDIDIENLKAKFDIKGKNGEIKLHVSNLEAAFSVYELKICGSTQTAKMLSNLLSPSRIDLKVYGEWLMPLTFSKDKYSWEVSKDAIFKLKIKKTVGGVSAIKLPDKLISWLLNTFLPNVIKDAIISSLPDKLGDLIHDEMTTIQLFGTINIRSDLPINIWQAKLHKDTSLGKFARSKLGITKDEADRLYFTTHHSAGRAAGFGSKLSMRGLHKFRLKYASCSDADVASLLDAVDRVANPKLESRGWLNEIMKKVDRLSLKSQTVNISINNANILFDLYTFVHTIVEIEVQVMKEDVKIQEENMLNNEKKKRKTFGSKEGKRRHSLRESDAVSRAKNNLALAKAASKFTFTAVDVAISIIEKTSMELKCLVRGGTDGLALLSLDDLTIAFHLLSFFEVIFPEQLVPFMHMAMVGANGPGKEEYKFSYFPIYGERRVLTPVELILGHTKLEFLSGLLTGFCKRLCLQFRSELFNELIDISNEDKKTKDAVDDDNAINNNYNVGSNNNNNNNDDDDDDPTDSKTASSNSNNSEDVAENDGQNVLDDLIPFFLNDDHDLLLQTHGLSLEFARVDGYKLGMALKPTSQSMTDIKKSITEQQQDDNNMISFQITMSLSQLFNNL